MAEELTRLRKLYIDVPLPGYGTEEDLRKIFQKYLPILADVASRDLEYRNLTSGLVERADDIDILFSAAKSVTTKKDKERFLKGANNTLRADIKILIEIIENNPPVV
ncbi:MAG TPA: hypothetical protein VK489_06140 [Ferruginibacter sp.]|nr:hypothetical protein [Ferruginibacter sp.]